MRNKFCIFFLLIAIVIVLVLGIIVFLSLWSSFKCPDPGMIRVLDYFGIDGNLCLDTLCPDSSFGGKADFAVNPYQAGNPDRDIAFIIGSSVSYILNEVKYFTLFIVILTVLALNVYALIIYFVFDRIAKPESSTPFKPEHRPRIMGVMRHFSAGKDPANNINQEALFK